MFLLLAVVMALVAIANGQDRRASKVFPPEEEDEYGRGSYGGYDRYGDRGRGRGRYGGEDEQDRRASKVFPPEEDYGRGGDRGYGGGDEDRSARKVFPPEEQRGRGGGRGREFPPEEEYGPGGGGGGGRKGWTEKRRYILSDSERVVATDAGGMRVVRGVGGRFRDSPMHIGFITMEPDSMFIPQYLDSSLILFVERGEARIGSIYKDNLVEKDLKAGDLYRIQAGSAFYIVNIAQGQRLHIITSIDTAESIDWNSFESFSLGGGTNPRSVLAGFDTQTLATAFNVSYDAIDELLSSRQEGAIVFLNPSGKSTDRPNMWKRFLELGPHERKTKMNGIVNVVQKTDEEAEMSTWSLKKLLVSLLGENKDDDLKAYNIYSEDKADFRNDYGWSVEVDGDDYEPLKLSDFAVYLVNLTAGSMMAPHVNPTATEYGVVLSGTGNIQVVFPNGTLAMDAQVNEGDVFWIPRYFPFCQVASRSSPFVFFGFSTSARYNRPQFLAGQGSVLQTMMGPGVAAAFGLSEEKMLKIINAQTQSTILPSTSASPGGGGEEIPQGEGQGDPAQGDPTQGKGQGDPTQGKGQGDPAKGKGKGKGQGDPAKGKPELLMDSKIRMKNSFE
ncbi:putative rmlC-like cupin domain superfamily, rmlC-like jelly roll protein [Helianthus annuus]|nr:putative rmlC-like cupin domain superfamily, rmlC-like jelly roll protein [Helianthus annuus]KAJ0663846.1 putative rmlC-like cupin domain superfamily, rmlC-like jelly roll protein [Helianthus annuus]